MTHLGTVVFTEVTGELVDDVVAERFYPNVSSDGVELVWATWRRPTYDELVKTWPARRSVNEIE